MTVKALTPVRKLTTIYAMAYTSPINAEKALIEIGVSNGAVTSRSTVDSSSGFFVSDAPFMAARTEESARARRCSIGTPTSFRAATPIGVGDGSNSTVTGASIMIATQWKPIAGRPDYQVSNSGQVKWRERLRKLTPDSNGYLRVSFWECGKAVKIAVHILVAEAFLGSRPAGMVVRHMDGDHTNCAASNLRWGTPQENEADKDRHGTKANGTRHLSNKLAEHQVLEIRRRYVPRDPVNNLHSLGREFGVSFSSVASIVKRETWKHIP